MLRPTRAELAPSPGTVPRVHYGRNRRKNGYVRTKWNFFELETIESENVYLPFGAISAGSDFPFNTGMLYISRYMAYIL